MKHASVSDEYIECWEQFNDWLHNATIEQALETDLESEESEEKNGREESNL